MSPLQISGVTSTLALWGHYYITKEDPPHQKRMKIENHPQNMWQIMTPFRLKLAFISQVV